MLYWAFEVLLIYSIESEFIGQNGARRGNLLGGGELK
jgi:hypothetical protein